MNEVAENNNSFSYKDCDFEQKFFIDLRFVMKKMYLSPNSFMLESDFCRKYNLKRKGVFFCMKNKIGEGRFASPKSIFPEVYCERGYCHYSALKFAYSDYFDNVEIQFGYYKPKIAKKEMLHSICEFTVGGQKFVFDGANYLIMSSSLYKKLFNFHSLTIITKQELLKDVKTLNSILKSKNNYARAVCKSSMKFSFSSENKNNSGKQILLLGENLCIYLSNRKAFIEDVGQCRNFYVQINKELDNRSNWKFSINRTSYNHFSNNQTSKKEVKTKRTQTAKKINDKEL